MLGGEVFSPRLAYYMEYDGCALNRQEIRVRFRTELAGRIRLRRVELVPATLPAYRGQLDEGYLFTGPCLCPDLLLPVKDQILRPYAGQWRTAWPTITVWSHFRKSIGRSWSISCGQRPPTG